MRSCATTKRPIRFYNLAPTAASCQERIVQGLRRSAKELPPTSLYDDLGVRLFDRIGRAEGYCITSREIRALRRSADDLRRMAGKRSVIVHYGSGTSRTALWLLRSIARPAAYLPVDVSLPALKLGVSRLRRLLPELRMIPVRADITSCFALPTVGTTPARSIVYLSSSTFSSLGGPVATSLLQGAARLCGQRGGVLLGVDLRSDVHSAAWRSGDVRLLRAFNLNALANLNRQFGANFHLERFSHASVYNKSLNRVELRLVSRVDQTAKIDRYKIRLPQGESIRTECSHRYRWHDIERLAGDACLTIEQAWFDEERLFSLVYLRSFCGR